MAGDLGKEYSERWVAQEQAHGPNDAEAHGLITSIKEGPEAPKKSDEANDELATGPIDEVEEAAREALADVIAEPITDFVMRGVRLFAPGSENVAAGEGIDQLTEGLMAIADPARIPSKVAEAVVSHLVADLLASALGPVGPVAVIFAGNFAGELTHQALDGDRESGIQHTVNAIEITGTFADAQLGGLDALAESEPFRDYVGNLLGEQILELIPGGEREPGDERAAVAAYEVRRPEDDSGVAQVRPAAFTVFRCIPAASLSLGDQVRLTMRQSGMLDTDPDDN